MDQGGRQPFRVLIVDDSPIVRRIVERAVRRDDRLALAGTAASGEQALAKISEVAPDVVILDVAMPGMDGLEVLDVIRTQFGRLPVVIFSSLAEKGAKVTQEAIARGANDMVMKPDGTGTDLQAGMKKLLDTTVSVVATQAQISAMRTKAHRSAEPLVPRRTDRVVPPELVVVGASTGGPNALATLIDGLPAELPVPIAIVQHMPPVLTRYLARRLDLRTPHRVFEASHGDALEPGTIAIAPGDHHLEVVFARDGLSACLHQGPHENSCRPAVDVLFRSAAKVYGRSVLGVVMTGMGQDGLSGSRAIREAGGQVIVQSRETCVVWGMPRVVEEAGLADAVVPLPEMSRRLGLCLAGIT